MKKRKTNKGSKYVGRVFGGWLCAKSLVNSVSPSGKNTYAYAFGKEGRLVVLDNRQAAKVWAGTLTVDEVRSARAARYAARNAKKAHKQ